MKIYKSSFLLLLFVTQCFSQKNKIIQSKSPSTFARIDNLIVEVKNKNFQLSINSKTNASDQIIIKEISSNFTPINCKIISFTSSKKKLYFLTWEEKSSVKTAIKEEQITSFYSKVYNIETRSELLNNVKIITKIIEQVFLDKNKTASETQEKMRNEGYDFILNNDGSISQKSKKTEIKWIFIDSKNEFQDISKIKK